MCSVVDDRDDMYRIFLAMQRIIWSTIPCNTKTLGTSPTFRVFKKNRNHCALLILREFCRENFFLNRIGFESKYLLTFKLLLVQAFILFTKTKFPKRVATDNSLE
jgi:hypothetical protein